PAGFLLGGSVAATVSLELRGESLELIQTPPDHPLLVFFVREDPGDDVSRNELFARITLHVERGGAVTLDVAPADAAEAVVPTLEVLDAQIDPPGLGVAVDRRRRQIDDGVARGHRRDADARAAQDGQLSAALAEDRRADADYSTNYYSVRIAVGFDTALHF